VHSGTRCGALFKSAGLLARRCCLSQPESWRPRDLADPSPRQGHSLHATWARPLRSAASRALCGGNMSLARAVADRWPTCAFASRQTDVSTGAYTHGLAVYLFFPFWAAFAHSGTRCGALCQERRFFALGRCLSQPESWRPRCFADPSSRPGHSLHATWVRGDGVDSGGTAGSVVWTGSVMEALRTRRDPMDLVWHGRGHSTRSPRFDVRWSFK